MRALGLSSLALLVLLVPALAVAGGPAKPGSAHDPALFADHAADWINVVSNGDDYVVKGAFRISGATSQNDRMRLDWKSGGRVLQSLKCESEYSKNHTLFGNCSTDKNLKTTGPIDADLIFIDDQTDAEYLVTTYHVTVKNWKGPGKSWNWGILPDDLLSVAYVRNWYGDEAFHVPLIEFWSTAPTFIGDATLRCTVDGQKLDDLKAHVDSAKGNRQSEIQVDITTSNDRWSHRYQHYAVEPDIHFGSKDDHGIYDPARMQWLVDHPGKWDCVLRKDGHKYREFLFTVNDKGMVEPSEMQKGSHPVPTLSNVVLIDMKIPADNGVEQRLRPDAMRKSIGFGVAWPDGPSVKTIQAAFPPAAGTKD